MLVRLAHVGDARRIAAIHVDSWRSAYRGILPDALLDGLSVESRERFWTERLTGGARQTLVVEQDGAVLGWADLGACRDADAPTAAEVHGIYLDPRVYRQGYGRHLWAAARDRLAGQRYEQLVVWVLVDNHPARRFYEAMGGRLEPGIGKSFERDGVTLAEVRYAFPVQNGAE